MGWMLDFLTVSCVFLFFFAYLLMRNDAVRMRQIVLPEATDDGESQ